MDAPSLNRHLFPSWNTAATITTDAVNQRSLARVKIDALLIAQGWNVQDTNAVRFEVVKPDADDDEKKVLAPNMGDIDDASNIQLSGEIVIPISCVLRVI